MPPGRSSRRKKLGAAALGLLAALLVAELVCRIDRLFPGKVYSAEAMHGWLESRAAVTNYGDLKPFTAAPPGVDPSEHRFIPDPWSGWTSPFLVRRITDGTRWFRESGHEEAFDVVLLGGSFGAQIGNHFHVRLPELLATIPAVGSRPVRFWNLSAAAHKQPGLLHRLTGVLALGWKPDLVVCIDGYNELAIAAENAAVGVSPVYPSAGWWGGMARAGSVDAKVLDLLLEMRRAQERIASRARLGLRLGIWRSALLSRAWTEWLSGPQAEFRDARERHMAWVGGERSPLAARGPFDPADAPQSEAVQIGVRDGLIAWTDAARNMHAICRQRGLPFVHAIQPGLDDPGSKPASAEETLTNQLKPLWRDAIRDGYPLLRLRIDELAREGVLVHDGSRVFAERTETLYADGCHLNERGYELYGLEVLAWIRTALAAH